MVLMANTAQNITAMIYTFVTNKISKFTA